MKEETSRIRIKDIAQLAGVSVGTVDRVLHGRSGVSEESRKKVEDILAQLNYQPNMYASALASNKRYVFACLLPLHAPEDYWAFVVNGMKQAVAAFSDFNVSLMIEYYDQYESGSFGAAGNKLLEANPDGFILAPALKEETALLTSALKEKSIPYVFIDFNIPELAPLAFYGQHAGQSGCFAARMMRMLMGGQAELVIFRLINEGRLGSNQQQIREEGFCSYMQEHCPEVKMWKLDLHAKHPEEAESLLDAFFAAHPQVTCGIAFNSKAYVIGEYMQKQQRTDFRLMGYDLLERNEACLRNGSVDFIIAQQPTVQGYSSVECLCKHLVLRKKVKESNYMPINLLTVENMDFYLDAHGNND